MDHVHCIIKKPRRAIPIKQSWLRNSQLLLWIVGYKTSNKWSEIKTSTGICLKIISIECVPIIRVFHLYEESDKQNDLTNLVLNKVSANISLHESTVLIYVWMYVTCLKSSRQMTTNRPIIFLPVEDPIPCKPP